MRLFVVLAIVLVVSALVWIALQPKAETPAEDPWMKHFNETGHSASQVNNHFHCHTCGWDFVAPRKKAT